MKILLVDNKNIDMDTLMAAVGGACEHIETCSSFEEAAEKIKSFTPDVALLSRGLMSPVKQGLFRNVRLIIFAGDDMLETARDWSGQGQEALAKISQSSSRRRELTKKVEELLKRIKLRNEWAEKSAKDSGLMLKQDN